MEEKTTQFDEDTMESLSEEALTLFEEDALEEAESSMGAQDETRALAEMSRPVWKALADDA